MPERTDRNEAMRLAEPPNIDNLKKIAASDSTTAIRNALLASIKWIQCLEQSLKFEQAASFRDQVAELTAERDQLRAEVERLRVDAERWEWIADGNNFDESFALLTDPKLTTYELTRAVDAARTTHKDEG